jgi:tRNA G10  N-methylase Trm11
MLTLIHDDCLQALKDIPYASVDAVVTDPPYGLSFMGKKWDYDVPSVEMQEYFDIAKERIDAIKDLFTETTE